MNNHHIARENVTPIFIFNGIHPKSICLFPQNATSLITLRWKELEKIKQSERNSIQIDLMLDKREEAIDDNTSNGNEEEEDDDNEKQELEILLKEDQPMIEMNVTLGNFDANPIISSLLGQENPCTENGDNDDESDYTHGKDLDGEDGCNDSESNVILPFQEMIKTDTLNNEVSSKSETSDSEKAPLILEVRSTKRRKTESEKST